MTVQAPFGILKPIYVKAVASASTATITLGQKGMTPNCIWVGATGAPALTVQGVTVTFNGMAAGVWHPMPNFTAVTSFGSATGVVVGVTE